MGGVLGAVRATSLAGCLVLAMAGGGAAQSVDAVRVILGLFGTYQVVGMNSAHRMKDLDDFILSLVRHPAFPDAVDDVVIE